MTITVRPLEEKDPEAWLPLWYGYNSFYRNEVAAEVTENTFRSLHENTDGFFGLVAEHDGDLVGLAHAIFDPSRGGPGRTAPSRTPTWCSGTCSASTTSRVPKSGR